MLQDRLIERHRNVLLGLETRGRSDVLGVGQRRKIERAHDDPLVRDADADALAELVLGEQHAQRGGERLDIDHLAFANDARRERHGGGALDCHAAGARLYGVHISGFDVESDNGFPCVISHGAPECNRRMCEAG